MKTHLKRKSIASIAVVSAAAMCLFTISLPRSASAKKADTAGNSATYQLDMGDRKIVIYQPEVDAISGESITARSAISITAGAKAPVFGAARFTARTVRKKGAVVMSNIFVEDVTVPQKSEDPVHLKNSLNRSLEGATWTMAADTFDARFAEGTGSRGDDFNTAPPKIFYEQQPAVLVLVDGDPILQPSTDKGYQTVINTAYFIAYDTAERAYYLKGGKWWYRATALNKEWIVSGPPKAALQRLADAAFKNGDKERDRNIDDLKNPPKIILSTEPAELIVVNGAPDYVSIDGTNLLYIDNTESNVLVDVNSQLFYVLLAGRWYASPSIKGPWRFVPQDRLPADFAKIPDGSNASDVLVSVPGTAEADAATLEAAVPEVAAVDRNKVSTTAKYDGSPRFQLIAGTRVYYATNSNIVVLRINGQFFAVDNGIWFEAGSPDGPWVVATAVPEEVQDIPPSAPVYQVRYVYVYDYTPSVVYVGYTPGYYCSYVYHGTVVYGTGYYYRPWWGTVYHPYPVTFGFGVHYNPYSGYWGYPVGVSFGWISFGWFVSPFGFWGPAGYMYGYRHGYHHHAAHGFYHGYRHGYRDGYAAGRSVGYRAAAGGRPVHPSPYVKRGTGVRPTSNTLHKYASSRPAPASSRFKNTPRPAGTTSLRKSRTVSSGDLRRGAPNSSFKSSSQRGARTYDNLSNRRNPSSGAVSGNASRGKASASGADSSRFRNTSGNMFHKSAKQPAKNSYSRPATSSTGRAASSAGSPKPQYVPRSPQTSPAPSKSSKSSNSNYFKKNDNTYHRSTNSKPSFENHRSAPRPSPSRSTPSYHAPHSSGGSSSRPSGGGHRRH